MSDRVSSCILILTLFMFLLALQPVADLDGTAAQSTIVVLEPEKEGMLLAGISHGAITIDGDTNFSETALLEGWDGDGSPDNPYMIDGLDIDLGGGSGRCISISNTRVSFIISNCSLTGATSHPREGSGNGICLDNVTHGELENNILDGNRFGILIINSNYCTVTDNTCTSNVDYSIYIYQSGSNIVVRNTCTSNGEYGIFLDYSYRNTVNDNVCNNNDIGICLCDSESNTVTDNTCNNNRIGIYLFCSDSNVLINNMCTSNTKNDIYLYDSNIITEMTREFVSVLLLLVGLVGITLLGAGWWTVSTRGDQDEIIVPTRYRLVSWLRKRWSLMHEVIDELLEPDSSDK